MHSFLLRNILGFWKSEKAKVVQIDDKPFLIIANMIKLRYYYDDIGLIKFYRNSKFGNLLELQKNSKALNMIAEDAYEDMVEPIAIQMSKLKIEDINE